MPLQFCEPCTFAINCCIYLSLPPLLLSLTILPLHSQVYLLIIHFFYPKKSNLEFFHIVSKVAEGLPAYQANVCVGSSLLSVNGHDITRLDKNEAGDLMRNNKDQLKLIMAVPRGIKQQQLQRKTKPSFTRKDSHSSSTYSSSTSPEDPCGFEKCNTSFGHVKQSLLTETSAVDKTNSSRKKVHVRQGSSSTEQHNEAFDSSGKEDHPTFSDDETQVDKLSLCKVCQKEKMLKRLPGNKQEWPLKNIDKSAFIEICNDLDKHTPFNDIKVVAGYLGIPYDHIERVTQKYFWFGGQGAAEDILLRWVEIDPQNHSVGKLLEILREEKVGRGSAVHLIEEWLKASNCFGCGAVLRTDY